MLEISPTLSLPPAAVTQRAALLAVSGAGKSNAARAMAEEFFKARLPFVAIDPKGDWWGLRAGRDGTPKGGLDVVIFGGEHGDIPLERGGGILVADTIVDQRLSCVVDLSAFESEADKKAFLLDFAKRLYHRNRDPLHLFLEEADDYLPQKPMHDEAKLLRAFENIVRRGRSRGLGITLITQRSAVVNKNVLTQVETLFALRTTGPQDIAAIEAWMKYHGADREMLGSLAGLEDGEAWVWSPHHLKKTQRFRFRRSNTFDSGATPTNHAAGSRRVPATLADVDLASLKERMAATLERAAADDPKALRKRIAELEKQLQGSEANGLAKHEAELAAARGHIQGLQAAYVKQQRKLESALATLRASITDATSAAKQLEELILAPATETRPFVPVSVGYATRSESTHKVNGAPASTQRGEPSPRVSGEGGLGKCARALLAALVQHGDLPLQQAAIVAQYSPVSSIVPKSAGELRGLGLVSGSNAQLTATPAGRQHPEMRGLEPFPVGRQLAEYWLSRLGKCEEALLRQVLASHPKPISLEKAAVASDYSPTSSIVPKSAGRLRTLMLINGSNAGMTANARLVS
jgi:uncharacterized protein